MTCVEYSGFKFCGLKIPTMDILTGEQKLTLEKIAKVLSAIKTAASDTRSVPIYIQTKPFDRARAHSSSIGINHAAFNGSSAYFSLAYTELNSYPRLLETAVHEYAHTIDFMSGLSEKDKYKFDQITIEGNTEIARTMMINNNCCGEKQFPDLYYAERTNSLELWAQFFTWWYLHNDEFRKAIAVDSPVSEPCKQVLKFMYAVLQQTFPSVIPYDQVTTTSAANADVQVGVRQIPALLTASGSSPGSIDAIMLEAGFKKTSQLIKTESVVPLTSTVFTSDQIINGNWVKANYSKASFSDKVAVQYQAMTSTIKSSIIAQNISNLATTAINKFNQAYDALLKEFGWYRNTGNVKGTIVDESGVGIANMTVEFAGKYALTDQKGAYSITNVQSGETEVDSVKDLYTQEEYTILNPDRITITASRTAQITSKIKFIKVKLSGKITSKNGTAQKNFKILFTGPGGRKFEATSDVNGDYSLDGLYYEQYNVSVYSGKTAQSLDSLSKTVTPKKTIQGSNIVNFNVQLAK